MDDQHAEPGAGPRREPWPAREAESSADCQQARVTWRELLAVALMVVLADRTLFRGYGLAGYAAFFLGASLLLALGAPRPRFPAAFWIVGLMLLAVTVRLVWAGWGLPVVCGFVLLVALAMSLVGIRPYVLELIVFALQSLVAGYAGLAHYRRTAGQLIIVRPRPGAWLNIGLPLVALVVFGLLFIVANPDLMKTFGDTIEWLSTTVRAWILDVLPSWREAFFWLAVLWITIGLLRPLADAGAGPETAPVGGAGDDRTQEPIDAPLYAPFRNTLLTVIALFAVYLVFEFRTLWFRDFPPGFHYSGYAHEGAAWLTVALALATVVLSLIFRGTVLRDARLPRLRRLAWIWSLENVVLAIAVYHRLFIYIGFNGMTRMRTIGLFGISCVVVGLILVVWKLVRQRDFVWLVRRQLWALSFFVYLYALTPVDSLIHQYNVRRIMAGDSAPSVQLSVHPISAEGILVLFPLIDCPDSIVREGVLALLADRRDEAERLAIRRDREGWTSYQVVDLLLLEKLRAHQTHWAEYSDLSTRQQARARFDQYAYQWF
jgi:hypothetical protein